MKERQDGRQDRSKLSLYKKSYENPLFCELITIFKKREELLIDGAVGTCVCHDLRLSLRSTL